MTINRTYIHARGTPPRRVKTATLHLMMTSQIKAKRGV